MMTIRQLMQLKGQDEIISVSPEASVFEALQVMAAANTGAVIVQEKSQMVGIFTERDYARKITLQGKDSRSTLIRDIMTTSMITLNPEQSLEECMEMMTNFHIRHLPVLENGRLVGMVSQGDVVKAIIDHKDKTIKDLENYILGEGGYAR